MSTVACSALDASRCIHSRATLARGHKMKRTASMPMTARTASAAAVFQSTRHSLRQIGARKTAPMPAPTRRASHTSHAQAEGRPTPRVDRVLACPPSDFGDSGGWDGRGMMRIIRYSGGGATFGARAARWRSGKQWASTPDARGVSGHCRPRMHFSENGCFRQCSMGSHDRFRLVRPAISESSSPRAAGRRCRATLCTRVFPLSTAPGASARRMGRACACWRQPSD